jgi:hypothetical protein
MEMWTGSLSAALDRSHQLREEYRELTSVNFHLDHALYVCEDGRQVEATLKGFDEMGHCLGLLEMDEQDIDPSASAHGVCIVISKRSQEAEPGSWYWLPIQLELNEIDDDEDAVEVRPEIAVMMRQEFREYARLLGWSEARLQERLKREGIEEGAKTEALFEMTITEKLSHPKSTGKSSQKTAGKERWHVQLKSSKRKKKR